MNIASGRAIRIVGWLLAGSVVSQVVCLPAMAGLGGDATSVQADSTRMKATIRVRSTTPTYTVHEITTPTTTVIHEYVNSSGKVFAVTWQGPTRPDLEQTLGAYYADFVNAGSTPHPGHNHLSVNRADLVIESNGRMRNFYGSAFLPNLFPADFTVADIK